MPEVFVARQPIFDRSLHVAGYELLFRGGEAITALVADSERATASVVLNAFTEIGPFSVIDALMDAPIEDVVEMIPFPADMRHALTHRTGEKGRLLDA